LALRAVIFDYGMVLTGRPDPAAFEAILHITGLPVERLSDLYWADRHAYDEGKLTGLGFWQKLVADAGLSLSSAAVEELNDWDARMWTTVNPAMLAWQEQVRERGLRTAILSNMGDNVHDRMEREFDWLSRFDVLVWSYQLRLAKPDPAIYRYALEKLGTAAAETLFIDDRQTNVDAALAMGMKGHVFTTVDHLRDDLIAQGLDAELPLPAPAPVSQA
jgi:putative hydrolase of the HAD superfamily